MEEVLAPYLPENALTAAFELIKQHQIHLKIVNERATRHGDYRKTIHGQHQITVNASLNKYRFLMTLIHEIAHLVAIEQYGSRIKPHGVEWKMTFQRLMLPFIRPEIYPSQLLPLLARHFRNPSASSDTDAALSIALKQFDDKNSSVFFIYEVPLGSYFKIANGKVFKRGPLRVKRFECLEVDSGRMYTFKPNAEVELLSAYINKK
ncbi:SprT-like domain-containing protein [Flavobacterium sp. JP2137]|uniref:SprT-like domain-containing protein n=1 Tax=Flavobacterium sp. JP2137 TaxID=3414510 RepID=UPI003D2FBF89